MSEARSRGKIKIPFLTVQVDKFMVAVVVKHEKQARTEDDLGEKNAAIILAIVRPVNVNVVARLGGSLTEKAQFPDAGASTEESWVRLDASGGLLKDFGGLL